MGAVRSRWHAVRRRRRTDGRCQRGARRRRDPGTDATLDAYRRINHRHWVALERGGTTPERLRTERWQEFLADRGVPDADPTELGRRYLGHLAAGSQLLDGAEEVVTTVAATHRIADGRSTVRFALPGTAPPGPTEPSPTYRIGYLRELPPLLT